MIAYRFAEEGRQGEVRGGRDRAKEKRRHEGGEERRERRGGGTKEGRGKRREQGRHKGTVLLLLARNTRYNQLLFQHQSGPHDNCPGF